MARKMLLKCETYLILSFKSQPVYLIKTCQTLKAFLEEWVSNMQTTKADCSLLWFESHFATV